MKLKNSDIKNKPTEKRRVKTKITKAPTSLEFVRTKQPSIPDYDFFDTLEHWGNLVKDFFIDLGNITIDIVKVVAKTDEIVADTKVISINLKWIIAGLILLAIVVGIVILVVK